MKAVFCLCVSVRSTPKVSKFLMENAQVPRIHSTFANFKNTFFLVMLDLPSHSFLAFLLHLYSIYIQI